MLIGETGVSEMTRLKRYYGTGDELHLAINFPFMEATFEAAALRATADATYAHLLPEGWPLWALGNHDVSRYPSRWCQGDLRKARCAPLILLALPGTPILYYGDEIALPDTPVPFEALTDPIGITNLAASERARPGADPDALEERRGWRIHPTGTKALVAVWRLAGLQCRGPVFAP